MRRVLVLNGVNLGRLGTREPLWSTASTTHAELTDTCIATGPSTWGWRSRSGRPTTRPR